MKKKLIQWAVLAVAAVVIFSFAWTGISNAVRGMGFGLLCSDTTEAVVQYYKRMDMLFLVTAKDTMRTLFKHESRSFLFGDEIAWLDAEVTAYWGIDCTGITRNNLDVTQERITVTLPGPELLDFKINLGSRDQLIKQSALRAIGDALVRDDPSKDNWAAFENEVNLRVLEQKPSKDDVLARLDDQTQILSALLGVEIELR